MKFAALIIAIVSFATGMFAQTKPHKVAKPEGYDEAFVRVCQTRTDLSIGRCEAVMVWIGMTEHDLYEHWGFPDHENKTITANGTESQLVYL